MRSRTSSRSPWSRRSASSACRRNAPTAPDLPSGDVVTIEGRFISLAGDPSAPGIVGFSGDWPNVLADVQLYGTDSSGEKLSEDIEVSVSQGGESYPAALLPDPTITAGQAVTTPGLSPATAREVTDGGQGGGRHRGRRSCSRTSPARDGSRRERLAGVLDFFSRSGRSQRRAGCIRRMPIASPPSLRACRRSPRPRACRRASAARARSSAPAGRPRNSLRRPH